MTAQTDVSQMKLAAQRMRARKERLSNVREPISAVAALMLDYVRRQFASGGGAGGTPWIPLRPGTLRQKASLGYPPDPLIRTGALAGSWSVNIAGDGTSGELASDSALAAYHQYGTDRLPARPMAPDGDTTASLVRSVFERHVRGAMEVA